MIKFFLLFFSLYSVGFFTSCSGPSSGGNQVDRRLIDSTYDERVVLIPETVTQSVPVTSDPLDFVYHIPVQVSGTSVMVDALIDDMKCIKLETNPRCLLGALEQVFIHKEQVYILSINSIYCFDLSGKFLYSISKLGKGPGEYRAIYNFCIDNDIIYLNTPRNIMCFEANSGVFIRSIPFDYFAKYMVIDGGFLYMDRSGFPNPNIPADGRLLVSRLSAPEQVDVFLTDARFKVLVDKQFYGYNSSGYFMDPYYNQVFKAHNGVVVRYIFYDCGDSNLTLQEIIALVSENRIVGSPSRARASGVNQVYESSSHIISTMSFDNLPMVVLFDKGSGNSMSLKFNQIKRGTDYPLLSFPWGVHGVYGEYFCSSLLAGGAINLQGLVSKSGMSISEGDKYYSAYADIMNTTEEDNPLLILTKFKVIPK